jgi:hypothetical protein
VDSTLAQATPTDLEALFARVADLRQMGAQLLAEAWALQEGLDRVKAAIAGAPVPVSPGCRRLAAVPPLSA